MESGALRIGQGAEGRFLGIDDRGVGLRATWRPAHGFVNLSLWRGDQCVETFHLTPQEVSDFVSFLVSRLATLAPAEPSALALVEPVHPASRPTVHPSTVVRRAGTDLRSGLASALKRAAAHIEP